MLVRLLVRREMTFFINFKNRRLFSDRCTCTNHSIIIIKNTVKKAKMAPSNKCNKEGLLNKFLSSEWPGNVVIKWCWTKGTCAHDVPWRRCDTFVPETYHMIEQCDKSIADWAPTGDSFVIKDIDSFTKVSISLACLERPPNCLTHG